MIGNVYDCNHSLLLVYDLYIHICTKLFCLVPVFLAVTWRNFPLLTSGSVEFNVHDLTNMIFPQMLWFPTRFH